MTGGWQAWQQQDAGTVQLKAGTHTLSAYFFSNVFNVNCFIFTKSITGIGQQDLKPGRFDLGQNFPNPFNPRTAISYQLPVASNVSLKIFDVLGRVIATLVDGVQEAGAHTSMFDASKLSFNNATSGSYFYQLSAGQYSATRRMSLLK